MQTATTAAVAAAAFVALFAGHHIGDHVVQFHRDGLAKAAPGADQLAAGVHPWKGWASCARHVATYTTTQALALLLIAVVAPLTWAGSAAALAASAATHVVIDRRWPVTALIRVKRCQEWTQAPYLIDQSLHIGVLLPAAVLAAAVTGPIGTAATLVAGAILIAAALLAERRRATLASRSPVDPFRM